MNNKKVFTSVLVIYLLCLLFRFFEYFVLRTDSSVIGEAVIHKMTGIFILILAAGFFHYSVEESGFSRTSAAVKMLIGLAFGLICFATAYLVEISILKSSGSYQGLSLYVTSYSISGNLGNQTALGFFIFCFIGNIINVIMEEGLFRGLFVRRLQERYSFLTAALISAGLFGLWHGVAPLRSFIDGESSAFGLLMNSLILILTSALVGFKFSLLTKLTGSVYMSMGEHFVNNTLTNILHVLSDSGADNFQVIRISIAQSISFILVLLAYLFSRRLEAKRAPLVLFTEKS